MKKFFNRLYYPAVVLLALCILSFFYYEYKRESIPDSFTLIEGETSPVLESNNIQAATLKKGTNSVNIKLFGMLPLKTVSIDVVDRSMLIPCGMPVGIYIETEGVLVIDVVEVTDAEGNKSVPAGSKVYAGDYILEANGIKTESKDDLIDIVNNSKGEDIVLKISRNDVISEVRVKPVKTADNEYMLGIWIRDNTQGVGMLTFVTLDGKFGALGHGIYDPDTNKLMELSDGSLYQADILDVVKGKADAPGELIGSIYYSNSTKLGDITANTDKGIYGTCSVDVNNFGTAMQIGYKQDIETGAAEIYTCVDGELKAYDIEIVDIDLNAKDGEPGFMVKVVDEELLEHTGGIVQGMSGSPVIQNGKIIGAVTHVLVNDPTRGYGIFIEDMLKAGD